MAYQLFEVYRSGPDKRRGQAVEFSKAQTRRVEPALFSAGCGTIGSSPTGTTPIAVLLVSFEIAAYRP